MTDWKTIRPPMGDDVPSARLLYGQDVRTSLQGMEPSSVHCVVTSPPYWGLRSYLDAGDENKDQEIGSEGTLAAYVENLVDLFRELRRVLRKDGVVWLNLGSSYAGGGRAGKNPDYWAKHTSFGKADTVVKAGGFGLPSVIPDGLKPKDLIGEPWRVAFALQADGWYLRSAAPWVRKNVMPESCTDRPSSSVEYIFLLAHPDSGGRYYYDIHGHRSPLAGQETGTRQRRAADWFFESVTDIAAGGQDLLLDEGGDPMAFVVNPKPYAGSHFAVFPPKLVSPCLLLSTSAHGACASCGAQWRRLVTREGSVSKASGKTQGRRDQGLATAFSGYEDGSRAPTFTTTGWEPGCDCSQDKPVRPVVLDPFSGSGTTGMVALSLGLNYVGLDLNESYLPLAEARILQTAPPDLKPVAEAEGSVFDMFGSDE